MDFELKIKKTKIFVFISLLLLGEIFLFIIFEKIPLLSSFYFLCLCWLLALFFLKLNILWDRSLLYVYFFILLYFILMLFDIYNIDFNWFLNEILPVFIAIAIYTYFIKVKDFKGLALISFISLIFIFISLITSIIGLNKYPLAARELAGVLALEGDYARIDYYRNLGIGNYGFFSCVAFMVPVIVYQIRKNKGVLKTVLIVLLIFMLLGLVRAQYTTQLMIGIVGLILAIGGTNRLKTSVVLVSLLLLIIIFTPRSFISDLLASFSNIFSGSVLQERLYDLSIAINQGFGSTDTHAGMRAARIPFLLNEFSKSPIIGGGESTGHVFWLDRLSMYGLIGIIPWILIITYQIKFNLKNLNNEFQFYYLISIIAFIALGFYKNTGGKEVFISIFLIIPGLNYLDYLYKPQINKLKHNKYNYNLYANE